MGRHTLYKSGELRRQSRLEIEIWEPLVNRRFSKPRLLNEISKRADIETKGGKTVPIAWEKDST